MLSEDRCTGGTGKVGIEVVDALLKQGTSVRILTQKKNVKPRAGVEATDEDLSQNALSVSRTPASDPAQPSP